MRLISICFLFIFSFLTETIAAGPQTFDQWITANRANDRLSVFQTIFKKDFEEKSKNTGNIIVFTLRETLSQYSPGAKPATLAQNAFFIRREAGLKEFNEASNVAGEATKKVVEGLVSDGIKTVMTSKVNKVIQIAGLLGLNDVYDSIKDSITISTNAKRFEETQESARAFQIRSKEVDKLLKQSFERCQSDPQFCTFFSEVWKGISTTNLSDSLQKMFDKNPEVKNQLSDRKTQELLIKLLNKNNDSNGELSEKQIEEIKNLIKENFKSLSEQQATALATLKETVNANEEELAELEQILGKQSVEAKRQELIQLELQSIQRTSSEVQAGFGIIGMFSNIIKDPGLAQDVRAAATFGSEMTKVYEAAATMIATSTFSMALTGNIIGAIFNIASLFSSGPTPDQMILEQIGKLREELSDLRIEMHDRFDRVDHSLTLIHEKLDSILSTLLTNHAQVLSKIQELKSDILNNLSLIEKKMDRSFRDLWNQEFKDLVFECLDYPIHNATPMPESKFELCKNGFLKWASERPFENFSAAFANRRYEQAHWYTEFTNENLFSNLNYIFSISHGGNELTDAEFPNLSLWAVATMAFVQLAKSQPQHLHLILPGSIDLLAKIGTGSQSKLNEWLSFDSKKIKENYLISALDFYDFQNAKLVDEFSALVKEFKISKELRSPDGVSPPFEIDLDSYPRGFGGTTPTLDWGAKIDRCDNKTPDAGPLPMRTSITQFFHPNLAIAAKVLKLPTSLCYSNITWAPEGFDCNGQPEPKACHMLKLEIRYQIAGQTLETRVFGSGRTYGNVQGTSVPHLNRKIITNISPESVLRSVYHSDEAFSGKIPFPFLTSNGNNELISSFIERTDQQLNIFRQELIENTLAEFQNLDQNTTSGMKGSLRGLAGAKYYFESLLFFSFPGKIIVDDDVRSLIYGTARLKDPDDLKLDLLKLKKQFYDSKQFSMNFSNFLTVEGSVRTRKSLNDLRDKNMEGLPLISNTIDSLEYVRGLKENPN